MAKRYDIAAYVWPSYTGREMRSRIFWPMGIGEWQTVLAAPQNRAAKPDSYRWDRRPLWGPRDEADPEVMRMQIDEAVKHGVNVFIYDWYWYDHRPFLEQCLDEGFLGASNNGKMSFYLMWANHNAHYTWDTRLSDTTRENKVPVWMGYVNRGEFEEIVRRIIDRYFTRPNYYKIQNRPVFMIYHLSNFVRSFGSVEAAKDAVDYFRAETIRAGFDGLELQFTCHGPNTVNQDFLPEKNAETLNEALKTMGFNSFSHYQFGSFCSMHRDYSEIIPDALKEWERAGRDYGMTYYPHVSVGWDSNPRFTRYHEDECRGNTPEMVGQMLREAKKYVDTHDLPAPLITVNSWNEWTETSYLEPDNVYGYGYLEQIKKIFLDGENV